MNPVVCLLLCVLMAVPAMDALTQEGIKVRQQASGTEGQFSINNRAVYVEGQAGAKSGAAM